MRSHFMSVVVAFVLAISFSAIGARAAMQVGDKPDLKFQSVGGDAIDLANLRGKIVIVDFWATWCGPCMHEAGHMVSINEKYASQGVQLLGISLDQDKSALDRIVKEKQFTWPQYFDGQGWQNKYATAWGVHGIPATFLIGPDGVVLWTGHPAMLDPELAKAMKEHPPVLVDPKVLADATALLDQVNKATASKDYPAAMKLLAKVPPAAKADPKFAGRLDDASKTLADAADAMLAEAEPLIANKQYTEAAAKLKSVASSLDGTAVGTKAKQKLAELKKIPEAATAIAAADRADKANVVLEAAQKLQAAKSDQQAYVRFKFIVKEYAGTPAAATAADAVKAYDADPAFAKQVATAADAANTAKAKSLLNLANSYLAAGNSEKAKRKFQEVIDQYPTTPQAQTAKEAIAKMGS